MKRRNSGLLIFGLFLVALQILSFAGRLKAEGSSSFYVSNLYDLGVLLVSTLPGILGIAFVICSFSFPQKSIQSSDAQATFAKPSRFKAWSLKVRKLLSSRSSEYILFIILVVFLGCVFRSMGYEDGYAEGCSDGQIQGYEDGREDGKELGREEGYEAGYSDGSAVGYEDGYAHGRFVYYDEASFFRRSACIVTVSGSKYHHYGCHHIGDSSYWIYNVELAEAKGYTPCLDCWDQGLGDNLVLPPLS